VLYLRSDCSSSKEGTSLHQVQATRP
jgi:hypothetical protein